MKIRLNGQHIDDDKSHNSQQSKKLTNIMNDPIIEAATDKNKSISASLHVYRLYLSEDIKAVCRGDTTCLVEESTNKISTPKTNTTDTPYYWRVDTVLANGEILEGRVWSI